MRSWAASCSSRWAQPVSLTTICYSHATSATLAPGLPGALAGNARGQTDALDAHNQATPHQKAELLRSRPQGDVLTSCLAKPGGVLTSSRRRRADKLPGEAGQRADKLPGEAGQRADKLPKAAC